MEHIELIQMANELDSSNLLSFLQKYSKEGVLLDSEIFKRVFSLLSDSTEQVIIDEVFASIISDKNVLFLKYLSRCNYKERFQKYLEDHATDEKVIRFLDECEVITKELKRSSVKTTYRKFRFEQFRKVIEEEPKSFVKYMINNREIIKNDNQLEHELSKLLLEFDDIMIPNEMFWLIIRYSFKHLIPYMTKHMEEFQLFLEEHIYEKEIITFLMKSPIVYSLDSDFLFSLYNKHLKETLPFDPAATKYYQKIFDVIGDKIGNPSPMVKILPNSNPIHLHFALSEKPDENTMEYYSSTSFQNFDFKNFVAHQRVLIEKLYNYYYASYQKVAKEENESLYDFVRMILFSKNNFKRLVLNDNFSSLEIRQLMHAISTFNHPKENEFKAFYNEFFKAETIKWNKLYSWFINNRNNDAKISEGLTSLNLTQDTAYSFFLKNKFLNKFQKTELIEILDYHFGKGLRIIDVIDILEEMSDKEITIDEILVEKDIEKPTFMKLYHRSAEKNPELHDFIANKLNQNRVRGFKKLLKLGYSVLNSKISTLEEYKQKYSNYPIEQLLDSLKSTELFEPLLLKTSTWDDYIPSSSQVQFDDGTIKK